MRVFADVQLSTPTLSAVGPWPSSPAFLEAIPGHVAILDSNGIIISVNDAWRRFAVSNGYRGSDFGVGTSYLSACGADAPKPNRYARDAASLIGDVLAGDRHSGGFVYPCHAPDQRRWFRMLVSPLQVEGKRRAIVAHFDATAECEAQLATVRELKRLRRAGPQQERLAGIVHDVKSPLSAISGMCDYLVHGFGGPTTEKQEEYLRNILVVCEQMAQHIDQTVLDVLDDETGAIATVDVSSILLEIERYHRLDALRRGLILRCDSAARLPGLAVPAQVLRRIVQNLVSNALSHAGAGATVVLSARAKHGRIVIDVTDDGAGIESEAIGRVQRPRERGGPGSGSGLGLAIVRDLVSTHGGTLSIASAPGQGFRVTIEFAH